MFLLCLFIVHCLCMAAAQLPACAICEDVPAQLTGPVVAVTSTQWSVVTDLNFNLNYTTKDQKWPAIIFESTNVNCHVEIKFSAASSGFRIYPNGRHTTWDYLVMGQRPLFCCYDGALNGTVEYGTSSVSNQNELAIYTIDDDYKPTKFNLTYRQLCAGTSVSDGFLLQSPKADGTAVTIYANNSNFPLAGQQGSFADYATAFSIVPPLTCGIQLELTSYSEADAGSCGIFYGATYLFPSGQNADFSITPFGNGSVFSYKANCSSFASTLIGLHVTPHRVRTVNAQLGWQTFNLSQLVDPNPFSLGVLVITRPEDDGITVTSLDIVRDAHFIAFRDICVDTEPGWKVIALAFEPAAIFPPASADSFQPILQYRYYTANPLVLSAKSLKGTKLQQPVYNLTSYRVLIHRDPSFDCDSCSVSIAPLTSTFSAELVVFLTGEFGSSFNVSTYSSPPSITSFPNATLAIQIDPTGLEYYATTPHTVFGFTYKLQKPQQINLPRKKWSNSFLSAGSVSMLDPNGAFSSGCVTQIVVLQKAAPSGDYYAAQADPKLGLSVGCLRTSQSNPNVLVTGQLANFTFSDCPAEDISVYPVDADTQIAARYICSGDQVDPNYLYLPDVIGTPLPPASSKWKPFDLSKSKQTSQINPLWTIRASNPLCQVQIKFSDIELSGATLTEGGYGLGQLNLTSPHWLQPLTGNMLDVYGQKSFGYASCTNAVFLSAYPDTTVIGQYRQLCNANVMPCGAQPHLTVVQAMMNEWRTFQLVAVNFNQAQRKVLRILAPSIDSLVEVKFSQVNTMVLQGDVYVYDTGYYAESQLRGTVMFPTAADAEYTSAYDTYYDAYYYSPPGGALAHLGSTTEFGSPAIDIKTRVIAQPQDAIYTVQYRARSKNETNDTSLVATPTTKTIQFTIPDMTSDRALYLKQLQTPLNPKASGSSAQGTYPIWSYKDEWIIRPLTPLCRVALTVVNVNIGNGDIHLPDPTGSLYPSLSRDANGYVLPYQNRLRIVLNGSEGVEDIACTDTTISSMAANVSSGSYCAYGNVTYRGGAGDAVKVRFQSWYRLRRSVETTWGPGGWAIQYWQDCARPSMQGPSILATGVTELLAYSAKPTKVTFPVDALEHMEYCDLRWRISPVDLLGNATHRALVSIKVNFVISATAAVLDEFLAIATSMEDSLTDYSDQYDYEEDVNIGDPHHGYSVGSATVKSVRLAEVITKCVPRTFFKIVSIEHQQLYVSRPTSHPTTITSTPQPTVNPLLMDGWSCDSDSTCSSGICSNFLKQCTAKTCAATCATKSTQATCLPVALTGCSCSWVSSKCVPL